MKINWKKVSKTSGYISLKKAMTDDSQRMPKCKLQFYAKFQWVINRAKHYAAHTGKSLQYILYTWEKKRKYSWASYYHDCNQPKFHSNTKLLLGVRGQINYYKTSTFYKHDPRAKQKRISLLLIGKQKSASKKAKPRWSTNRKKRGY